MYFFIFTNHLLMQKDKQKPNSNSKIIYLNITLCLFQYIYLQQTKSSTFSIKMDMDQQDFMLSQHEQNQLRGDDQNNYSGSKIIEKQEFSLPHTPQNETLEYKSLCMQQTYHNLTQSQSKKFGGIQLMFGLVNNLGSEKFLEGIDSRAFQSENIIDLNKFFSEAQDNSFNHNGLLIDELTKKVQEIQSKVFNSISFNKTIGNAFYGHFESFFNIRDHSSFILQFQNNFNSFIEKAKDIKGPGIGLILMIYQFWMRMFRNFVRQIWKYSEKYTINFFKKQKVNENKSQVNFCGKSTSSSQAGQKDKRKAWTKAQIQTLQKIITSKAVFSSARIKQLAEQFDRTPSSIASKVQKLSSKLKKQQNFIQDEVYAQPELSNEQKIKSILYKHPEGLTKDDIISQISSTFKEIDESWKKSIGQLLSSKPQYIKIKGAYSLLQPQKYTNNYEFTNTLKDKVIKCLLKCENHEGDLKKIINVYHQQFAIFQGLDYLQQQKYKVIQANISKTLSRYDCFDKTKTKTIYKLASLAIKTQSKLQVPIMDVQSFLL